MTRSSGILLPVSALPGPCGIGDLGTAAREFIDFLAAAGQRYWQILPLNPPDSAHSPYLSASTFAGSTDLLSPEPFMARGALAADEVRSVDWGGDPMRVDYGRVHAFGDVIQRNRERDLRMMSTTSGPHRDDICFQVDGIDIRKFGSQGQQRTAALSLKLSEIELVKMLTRDKPVLLLDDVLSELDKHRQNYLLDSIDDIQTLITCTGVDEFVNHRFSINKIFYVHEGQVRNEN